MADPNASPFAQMCLDLRRQMKPVAAGVKTLADLTKVATPTTTPADRGEMIANLMLAYRHLEDASMRLGKAIQASNGGSSVYDRDSTVGA